MYKYIVKTSFKTLEFESMYHMSKMKAIDFFRNTFYGISGC